MKNLLLVVVFMMSMNYGYSQCLSVINNSKSRPIPYNIDWYLGGTFDLDNAFNITKNANEPKGLDFNLELGAVRNNLAYYVFYGQFTPINYINYGGGIDYKVIRGYDVDVLVGVSVDGIERGSPLTVNRIAYLSYGTRVKSLFKVTKIMDLVLIGKYQARPDRNIHGIFEVSTGIQININ